MKIKHEKLLWPQWCTWTLLAVIATSIVTVIAAVNDIY